MRKTTLATLLCAACLAGGPAVHALINPNFTPTHLVGQADLILALRIGPADAKGVVKAEVVNAVKGKAGKTQAFDTSRSVNPENTKAFMAMLTANGGGPALLFAGKGEGDEPISVLHLGGGWVRLKKAEAEDAWDLDSVDTREEGMKAVWCGGTDMLLKITELLLKHPDTDVPAGCGGDWDEPVSLGKVEGKVGAAQAVDVGGKGAVSLFVTSDAGDKLFAYDGKAKKFEDLTARVKLGSKSVAAAWGDFNGDGRLDLASCDGKGLTIWSQGADGVFSPTAVADVPREGCSGLAALDVGVKGRAGLVWSTRTAPVLLIPDKDKAGVFSRKALVAGAGALKDPTGPGACLVADFDGDRLADVLQPYAKGSVFYKGKGGADFAEGAVCAAALGSGRASAFLGDFDADGLLDVLATSEETPRLWQNLGQGRFENRFALSGEMSYIAIAGCLGGNACDINNDGLQDAFMTYPAAPPLVFFNRGYRSFGHAHANIDLQESNILPDAMTGQQAGALADLNADGHQDMALVLLDGTVWVLPQRSVDDGLAVRVALAPGGAYSGPLTVSATNDRRPLGSWQVCPGTAEAWFARYDAGKVTMNWQLPGGAPQEMTLILENKPIRFVIGEAKE